MPAISLLCFHFSISFRTFHQSQVSILYFLNFIISVHLKLDFLVLQDVNDDDGCVQILVQGDDDHDVNDDHDHDYGVLYQVYNPSLNRRFYNSLCLIMIFSINL